MTNDNPKRAALIEKAKAKGEKNDCAVKAVAVVCGVDYDTAHAALEKHGREERRGTPNFVTQKAVQELGFVSVSIKQLTNGRTVKTLKSWLERNLQGRKALIVTSEHICAWDGEEVVDWAAERLLRVTDVRLVDRCA